MGHDEDDFVYWNEGEARDLPLSGDWRIDRQDGLERLSLAPGSANFTDALSMIVATALVADRLGLWVSYSRNQNHYSHQQRYRGPGFSYRNVLAAVEALDASGFINHQQQKKGCRGLQSRFRGTEKLILAMAKIEPAHWVCEPIHLKDATGKRVPYVDDDGTRRMRNEMLEVNEVISTIRVDGLRPRFLPSGGRGDLPKIILPQKLLLHRVFNKLLSLGGRLFGGSYQNMPKLERLSLLIDGEEVDEPDHAQLHPRLLYALLGRRLTGEAYEIEGFERKIVKFAWQLMVNCSSRSRAVLTLTKRLLEEKEEWSNEARLKADELLHRLEAHHKPVANAFYSCVALKLQYVDSELLLQTLSKLRSTSIIGLPVHDSIICRKSHAHVVRDIMAERLDELLYRLAKGSFATA